MLVDNEVSQELTKNYLSELSELTEQTVMIFQVWNFIKCDPLHMIISIQYFSCFV